MVRPISIRVNILSHFIFVAGVIVVCLLLIQFYFNKQLALSAAEKTFLQTSQKISQYVQLTDQKSKDILYLTELFPPLHHMKSKEQQDKVKRRLAASINRTVNAYAMYVGFGDGNFFEVINMKSADNLHDHFKAPEKTRWTVIKVYDEKDQRIKVLEFYDDNFVQLSQRQEPSDYRADKRPWYIQALQADTPIRTDPYMFSNIQQKGITFSKTIQNTKMVLAIDVTLDTLTAFFRQQRFDPTSEIIMFGQDGSIIAGSKDYYPDQKTDAFISGALTADQTDQILRYTDGHKDKFVFLTQLSTENGKNTHIGLFVDAAAMLKPYYEKIYISLAIAVAFILLMVPLILYMTTNLVRPIKALMVENEKIKERRFESVTPVITNVAEFRDLSDSLIAMAKSIQEYQKSQSELMSSFIRLIADAIDAKSAYTGGHCKRVPEVAMMLVKAAHNSEAGAFKDFHFDNDDDWLEFEFGAWMHDCGKVTTPEFVVDKATKLETIYNRIHEIRTRFEILWRDTEIEAFKRLHNGEDEKIVDEWKKTVQRELMDDFAFIAECNVGGEYMSKEFQDRIKAISERRWIRHFSNRIGISEAELIRYSGLEEETLPVEEFLLDDKPEHIVKRIDFNEQEYQAQGFKLEVPEHQYNYGELYNLCIEKGTLTVEERFKINEHVIMTIKMLENLPYPEGMEKIPEYAGTHHETMIKTGYPRRLSRKDLSLPARVMVVADVFEALTASDRPYKKGKKLSEALKIMSFMNKDKHLDYDIFELFLRSGIYREYGKKHLRPDQVDEVDIDLLLA